MKKFLPKVHEYVYFTNEDVAVILKNVLQTTKTSKKPSIIAVPTIALVEVLYDKFQKFYNESDVKLVKQFSESLGLSLAVVLMTYHQAADHTILSECGSLHILHAYLIATSEHVVSLNKLLAESQIATIQVYVYMVSIPSSLEDFETLSEEFCHRYVVNLKKIPSCGIKAAESILQCSLSNGIEVIHGSLPFEQQLTRSNCPITDALLSTISASINLEKTCLIICADECEVKSIAKRIGKEFYDKLDHQNFPESRTAFVSGIKIISNVVIPLGNPFAKKYDGFALTLKKFNPLVVVGSRKSLLYSGYQADIVINLIFTKKSTITHAEHAFLYSLCNVNGEIITLTDDIDLTFEIYTTNPKIFNKVAVQLVNQKYAMTRKDVQSYFDKFLTPNLDANNAIEELIKNGSLTESSGQLEVNNCKYLSGFFATEKKRLLGEAFSCLDLKNYLYIFYLANLFFVDMRDILTLSKQNFQNRLLHPKIKKLSEKVGLHDPKSTSFYHTKIEACLILSSVCFFHYSNNTEPESENYLPEKDDNLFDFLRMNHSNLLKTSEICQEYHGSIFSTIFKQMASMCLLFDTSPLQNIIGLDFITVDALIASGVKTYSQFIHCVNLDRYIKPIASRMNVMPSSFSNILRKRAVSLELGTNGSNYSINNSRDLFSSSIMGDDVNVCSLCAIDEPELKLVFHKTTANEWIFLHLFDENVLKIVRISSKTEVYQIRLRCCDQCLFNNRLDEIFGKFSEETTIWISNSIVLSRQLAFLGVNHQFIYKSYCFTCLFYIIGNDGIKNFINIDEERFKHWLILTRCFTHNEPLTNDSINSMISIMEIIRTLYEHSLVKTVKSAINVLIHVYSYGIPYDGFQTLLKSYQEKKKEFPLDVQKLSNTNYIPTELHVELADNPSLLIRKNGTKKAKMVSTDFATNKQSSIFYCELSKIRKLNQAIELLNPNYFKFNSGTVYPDITFGGNGRIYMHSPNLQNFAKCLPFNDLKSPRSIITTADDYEIWSADYCEMELRMATLLSRDEVLLDALKNGDVFGMISQKLGLENEERANVKLFFYGLLYGMGVNSLEEYGFNKIDAKNLWKRFSEAFPKLDEYRNFLRQRVLNGEMITDYFGKPVNVEMSSAYSAINAVIQSSSAFVLLSAVSKISFDCPVKLLFLVHDEIIIQAPKCLHCDVPTICQNWMETKLDDITFPIKVSYGKSWDNLTKY